MREIYQIAQDPSQPGSYTTIGRFTLQGEGSGELQTWEKLKAAAQDLRETFGDHSLRFVVIENGEVTETED